jgi:hypothetical protein
MDMLGPEQYAGERASEVIAAVQWP